jgi:WD40 repeat protein
MATASDDGTLRVWELEASEQPTVLVMRNDDGMRSRSVAWSPDGCHLASGNDDGTVRVWDASASGQSPAVRAGHNGRVESVAWSPDGRLLSTAGIDGTVRLWDAADLAKEARVLTGHGDPVTAVAWSPDSQRLISGGEDRTVRLWDASSAAPVSALGLGSMVCSLAWQGDRIAVGMVTTWTVLFVEERAVAAYGPR